MFNKIFKMRKFTLNYGKKYKYINREYSILIYIAIFTGLLNIYQNKIAV